MEYRSPRYREVGFDRAASYDLNFKEAVYTDDIAEKTVNFLDYGSFVHVQKFDFEILFSDLDRLIRKSHQVDALKEKVEALSNENKLYKEKYGELELGIDDEILLSGRPVKLTSEHKRFIRLHMHELTSRKLYEYLVDVYGFEGKEQTVANFCSRLRRVEREREKDKEDKELDIDYSIFDGFSEEPFSDFTDEIKRAIRKLYAFDKVRDKAEVGRRIAEKYGVLGTEVEVYIEMFEKGAGWL